MVEKIRLKMYPVQPRTGTTYIKRPSGLSFKQEVHNASEMLKMIEKSGMLPPERTGVQFSDSHGAEEYTYHEWEYEDET